MGRRKPLYPFIRDVIILDAASLCSGIGGIDLAGEWVGIKTLVFCEREPFPQRVLRKHWPDVPIIDDIYEFNRQRLLQEGVITEDGSRTIGLISAGYPCQPFSHAGNRKGAEDDRHLWPEVSRILQEIRPRWFLGENVAGHISLGLDDVLADLESIGYEAIPIVLPAAGVGASHKRERVFIVGYSGSERRQQNTRSTHGNEEADERRTAQYDHEPERSSQGNSNRILANPTCELSHGQRRERGWRAEPSNSGETLANSPGERRGKTRECIVRSMQLVAGRGETLADSNGAGREKRDTPTVASGSGYNPGSCHERGAYRSAQPGMGRGPYELSDWLDGGLNPLDALAEFIAQYPQPALMGQVQYDWEPPRVASGVKNRTARLKALGNAVDPLQVLPILAGIKLLNDYFRA